MGGRATGAPSERSASPTPSTTSTSATSASRFEKLQSHMLTSLLSLQSIPPPNRQPVSKNKEPLSLPTTTRNFRGFVQKSGPVFLIQDTVHETLMWDHPARTLVVMAAWAVIGESEEVRHDWLRRAVGLTCDALPLPSTTSLPPRPSSSIYALAVAATDVSSKIPTRQSRIIGKHKGHTCAGHRACHLASHKHRPWQGQTTTRAGAAE